MPLTPEPNPPKPTLNDDAFSMIKQKYSKRELQVIIDGLTERVKILKSSIKDFNRCIELNPNHSEAYNNRAKSRQSLVESENALKFYTDILNIYEEIE